MTATGKKIVAQVYMTIMSAAIFVVVLEDSQTSTNDCTGLCGFYVFMSLVSLIITTLLIVLNILIELKVIKRAQFPYPTELLVVRFLFFLWIFGIIFFNLNANPFSIPENEFVKQGSIVKTFGWLSFLLLLFIMFQLHSLITEEKIYDRLTKEWEYELNKREEEVAKQRDN